MFYRRKVLLGLLEALDRSVLKVDFQKYLFLVCTRQDKPAYEFVPHRFGCFSFQVDADKRTLTKYGMLKTEDQWTLCSDKGYLDQLHPSDRHIVDQVVREFSHIRAKDLVRYVYRHHPYYAINSEIRDTVLNASDLEKVDASRPVPRPDCLFTIGYEGKSLEHYLNELIAQAVTIVCDIRRNPVSKKHGFSKRQLKSAVEALGMTYIHMPELGIESRQRQNLHSAQDYRSLFDEYVRTTLSRSERNLLRIIDLLQEHGRLALTCFEAGHNFCHRSYVAEALERRGDFHHRAVHLKPF